MTIRDLSDEVDYPPVTAGPVAPRPVPYELGQVFERLGIASYMPAKYVVVCEVRDEDHEKGLGKGLPCALALPWKPDSYAVKEYRLSTDPLEFSAESRVALVMADCHVFDVTILCREQPHHGDEVWRLVS